MEEDHFPEVESYNSIVRLWIGMALFNIKPPNLKEKKILGTTLLDLKYKGKNLKYIYIKIKLKKRKEMKQWVYNNSSYYNTLKRNQKLNVIGEKVYLFSVYFILVVYVS